MSIANGRAAHNWRPVPATAPCPICKHADWCSGTADGAVAKCMKVEAGSFKAGEQKDGARYYLHRLAEADRPDHAPRPPGPGTPRAEPDLSNRAYSAVLARLPL